MNRVKADARLANTAYSPHGLTNAAWHTTFNAGSPVKARFRQPIWLMPLVVAALVALLGWFGQSRLQHTIATQLQAELATTLNANVTALTIWMTNQTRMAALMADEAEIHRLSLEILEQPLRFGGPRPGPPRSPEAEEFSVLLRKRLEAVSYDAALLVATNFMVVANAGPGRLRLAGTPVSEAQTNKFTELFCCGQPVIITPYKPELPPRLRPPQRRQRGGQPELRPPDAPPFSPPPDEKGPPGMRGTNDSAGRRLPGFPEFGRGRRGDLTLMQVAAPVRAGGSNVAGALALIINPDREFSRMLSVARAGDSGETYAFDQHGLLLSRSRFDNQLRALGLLDPTNASSALNLRLQDPGRDLTSGTKLRTDTTTSHDLTRIVAAAVAGGDGVDVRPSRDYRGIPVVGAWRWLPEYGFGVATQADAAEAYKPLRVLQLVFISLFLLLILCACIMFLFSYRDVVWRQRLSEAELKLKRLGQYTLEEKIGEGGMGVVYRARHALMRRDTAIKLLLPGRADPASVARFEREVRLTCHLSHPSTIQIYDYGHTPEGAFYYVMELLHGLNLHDLVTRFGLQPEGRVIHILMQICDSLAEAHGRGLVHRDIKPANVYLCERGGVPDCVKVLDFGLVRLYRNERKDQKNLTGEQGIIGTPWFMSPESLKNSALSDPRSDIYAVGALGYFLLTREYVFNADTPFEVYEKQLTQTPVPPSRRSTNPVSAELEETLLRCLDKDSQRRPQTVAELRSLLLTSPRAAEWGPEQRAAWWSLYQPQPPTVAAPVPSEPATISIELVAQPER